MARPAAVELGADEYREIVETLPVMVRRAKADGSFDFFNPAWLRFTGRAVEQERGMGWTDGIHPADFDRCMRSYGEAVDRNEAYVLEYRLRTADGAYRWVHERGGPLARDGRPAGYVGSAVDIEDQKRREEERQIRGQELNHRSKNLLAVVQAIAFQTFRETEDRAHATEAFFGRLQTMAHTHDMLSEERWSGAELGALLRTVARPHGEEGTAFVLQGRPLWLPPKQAMAVALGLNELFTNAIRHGALSIPHGRVSISWDETEAGRIRLDWTEHGGPAVEARPRGLGLRLIETLARDAGGTVRFDFARTGFQVSFMIPLAARPRG